MANSVSSVTLLPSALAIPYPFFSIFHVPSFFCTTATPTPAGEFQLFKTSTIKLSISGVRTSFLPFGCKSGCWTTAKTTVAINSRVRRCIQDHRFITKILKDVPFNCTRGSRPRVRSNKPPDK
ncbi:hypothetical protein BDP27DRAFT_1323393 [Rhodocollybia butyracea]|uniref:Uncharacterized protein n=1 Tax=Rhodocollybia butyracea TaxID=206335 RepID=A0A9P5UA75_9AGAR|nr:hypothetical protein BDP27DRAFT_1323393 [Rhodocollybia butyracea]